MRSGGCGRVPRQLWRLRAAVATSFAAIVAYTLAAAALSTSVHAWVS